MNKSVMTAIFATGLAGTLEERGVARLGERIGVVAHHFQR